MRGRCGGDAWHLRRAYTRLRLRLRLRPQVLRVTTSGISAVNTNGGLPGEVFSGGLLRCEELTSGRARFHGRGTARLVVLVGMAAIGAAMALA